MGPALIYQIGVTLREGAINTHLKHGDQQIILALGRSDMDVPRNMSIIKPGISSSDVLVLKEGWALSYLSTGQGRQFAKLHFPGDFLGLPSIGQNEVHEHVVAVSKVRIARIRRAELIATMSRSPRMATDFVLGSQRVALADHYLMLALTRLGAIERLAFFLRRLALRVGGGVLCPRFDFPLRQEQIADCTGLTSVHVNRTLKSLRAERILNSARDHIVIADIDLLDRLASVPTSLDGLDLPWFSQANLECRPSNGSH